MGEALRVAVRRRALSQVSLHRVQRHQNEPSTRWAIDDLAAQIIVPTRHQIVGFRSRLRRGVARRSSMTSADRWQAAALTGSIDWNQTGWKPAVSSAPP